MASERGETLVWFGLWTDEFEPPLKVYIRYIYKRYIIYIKIYIKVYYIYI